MTERPVSSYAAERSRVEIRVGDELVAWVDLRPGGSSTIIAHTEVVAGHERQGLGQVAVAPPSSTSRRGQVDHRDLPVRPRGHRQRSRARAHLMPDVEHTASRRRRQRDGVSGTPTISVIDGLYTDSRE
jgi:hypothetical protein